MMNVNNITIGLFPMCADILHAGHIIALEEAKRHCDYLIVCLNTHPDGKNPIQSVFERYIQLSAVKYIDQIVPYQGREDLELLATTVNYNIRFLGSDYINKTWDGKHQEQKRGIKPFFISRLHDMSSTNLKRRITQ